MYSLELDKCVQEIKQRKAKRVLIQLPDGLKTRAEEIVDYIENNINNNYKSNKNNQDNKEKVEVFLWLTSCFGACDLPLGLDILNIDLMIQFGHNRFWKEEW
ncbi:hypothetical protein HYW74_03245 [Candidatus Pacearchaeota archaeon]|nr:hypothetical protein [Candidatus Pacearchaeota archaeon]